MTKYITAKTARDRLTSQAKPSVDSDKSAQFAILKQTVDTIYEEINDCLMINQRLTCFGLMQGYAMNRAKRRLPNFFKLTCYNRQLLAYYFASKGYEVRFVNYHNELYIGTLSTDNRDYQALAISWEPNEAVMIPNEYHKLIKEFETYL